ncbi:PREDICTED: uncharacterized protein LOC106749942, partial [Dinoponera quadriceps]|uniref:Uncharacterized protein LOC106749942 n=1 Tax=Dinoponera quadriceps TaxID=609295 RepID=A0A6P3Y5M9_DINQU
MDPKIKKYLTNDTIFNEINKRYISLEPKDIRDTNVLLKTVLQELIKTMQMQNSLFKKTYNRIVWTGSFYKKTKVGSPDEFDLNLIIQLPFKKAKGMKFNTNLPGYTKIYDCEIDTLNMDSKALRDMMSFIDDQSYLNQEKFRRWFESVLSSAANNIVTDKNNKINNYTLKIKKSGPAFTLLLQISNRSVSIDLVPVLAFSSRCYAPPCTRTYTQDCDRYWFLVPKPLNNKKIFGAEQNRYWRLSFYEFEKDILSKYGRAKPIIRHLKKLRDNQKWKCIASYYIETLCFHHLHIFETSNKESSTFLFFTMLKKLYEAFCARCIEYYWDKNLDLLEKIAYGEMVNMEDNLFNIIKKIEKQIMEKPDDPFAIATYI